jgi:preprotein translocase SecE subunit
MGVILKKIVKLSSKIFREFKKISWPNINKVFRIFILFISLLLTITIYIFLVDLFLSKIFLLIKKLILKH